MKFPILFPMLIAVSFSYAQTNVDSDTTAIGLGATTTSSTYKFSYQGHLVAYYGLGWYSDSDFSGAPTAYLGGYGGIKFFTSGSPRLDINNNGNIGIGTTSPLYKLHVDGGSAFVNLDNLAAVGGQITASNGYGNQNGAVRLNLNNGGAVSWIKGLVTGPNTNTGSAMVFGVPSNTADGTERMRITSEGYIGIGTSIPDQLLTVKGIIHSQEVKVDLSVPGPDYVFKPDYKLTSLAEVKLYIDKNHHLPEIPSAAEMAKNGLDLGDMNVKLLKKVEELTLYLIEQQSKIDKLQKLVESKTKIN